MNINGTALVALVTAPLIMGSLLGAPTPPKCQRPPKLQSTEFT
jgi:hypothetical protein